eukprot:TRINITY_DN9429_c0_g1_i1.p1 TRINITY_DN9429_c0_g1~~TRINITY_DN9429_c0_g1_i1.p1  ORF type:complete len:188 (-),score=19.99 TRINITY_DN9429_c0_g1_i1:417-980(-)
MGNNNSSEAPAIAAAPLDPSALQIINNASVTDLVVNGLATTRNSHPPPTCQLFQYSFPELGNPADLKKLYERFWLHYAALTAREVDVAQRMQYWSHFPILYSISAIQQKLVTQFSKNLVFGRSAMKEEEAEALVKPFLSAITGGQDLGDDLICLVTPFISHATFEWGFVVFNTRAHIAGVVHCSEED